MVTANSQYHKDSNIWFSFVVGLIIGGSGLYFLGTKNGRATLKKIIDLFEDMELSLEDVLNQVEEVLDDSNIPNEPSKNSESDTRTNIYSVLDKIKEVFPAESKEKRYFAKESTLQKGA